MKKFHSVAEVLDFAICKEIEAHDFYIELAEWAERPEVAEAFEEFSNEELRHKEQLESIKAGKVTIRDEEVGSLDIADSMEATEPQANLTYVQALVLGIRKEKGAFNFYTQLASISQEHEIKGILLKLAQEEAQHKLRLEVEYDLTTF